MAFFHGLEAPKSRDHACFASVSSAPSFRHGTERVPEKSWHNYSGLVQVRGRVWRGRKIESRLKIALGLSEN